MSGRLRDSRMIRVAMIAIVLLLVIAILDRALAFYAAREAAELSREALRSLESDHVRDFDPPAALESLAIPASDAIGGAIATIVAALIARYGAREATANLRRGPPAETESKR